MSIPVSYDYFPRASVLFLFKIQGGNFEVLLKVYNIHTHMYILVYTCGYLNSLYQTYCGDTASEPRRKCYRQEVTECIFQMLFYRKMLRSIYEYYFEVKQYGFIVAAVSSLQQVFDWNEYLISVSEQISILSCQVTFKNIL